MAHLEWSAFLALGVGNDVGKNRALKFECFSIEELKQQSHLLQFNAILKHNFIKRRAFFKVSPQTFKASEVLKLVNLF